MTAGLLGCAALALTLAMLAGYRFGRLWLMLNLLAALTGLTAAVRTLRTGNIWTWHSVVAPGGEPVLLRLDGLSALFLILVCVVGGLGALYSREYWSDHHYPGSAPRGRIWWSVLTLSMGLVLTCADGLHFLFAWEAFALSAYFLITLDNAKIAVRKAGWLYLAASHAGTMVLFAFFATLAARTGSWALGPVQHLPGLAPLFWLALFGFGVKAGMFPLYIWLPSAHANAPSHVSAIMSAVAIKMGIYGIIRFSGWLPLPPSAGWAVLGFGTISMLLGVIFALAQNDIKRLLAYCSVENAGIILTGLGLALLAVQHDRPEWGQIALAGTFLHILNHCLFKTLIFFGAGSVLHATDTRDMSRLGGLWRVMPWTAACFVIGAAAVSGLPPLNGFVSEWGIYLALFKALGHKQTAAGVFPAIVALAGAGALALAAFTKAVSIIFLGAPRTKTAARATECGWLMRLPMLLLAGTIITIGVMPGVMYGLLRTACSVWAPQWPATPPALPTGDLGMANLAVLVCALAGGLLVVRRIRANGMRSGLTWDCGYTAPSPRMQYTGGSFSGIAAGWFVHLLRPARVIRRVRGYFPKKALTLQQIPEVVLEHGIQPAAHGILLLADGAKRMQHGRLHLYILYVFLGVVALGLLVSQGGM